LSSELYLEDETARVRVSLPPPLSGRKHHLFCSKFNAGALELAEELRESDVFVTNRKKASAALIFTTNVDNLAECDHMLVLLDERTWTSGADTAKFVAHILMAMRTGVHICCVHEVPAVVGPHRHACDFTMMFHDDWTPAHLTGGRTNLYREVDVALKGEEWRQPGLVALADKLSTSAREHRPIDSRVPVSYKPKTGANPWAPVPVPVGDAACAELRAAHEPVNGAHAELRMSLGAAASVLAPPLKPAPPPKQADAVELVPMPPAMPVPPPAELAPMPPAMPVPPPSKRAAALPPLAATARNPVTAILPHLRGMLFAPAAASSARLDA